MSLWERWPAVVFVGAVGVGLGMSADLLTGVTPSFGALLIAPFAVTIGAKGVSFPLLHVPLLIGGCLFWPGLVFLIWRWARAPSKWQLLAVGLWCLQGFFQLQHRVDGLLSV